VEVEGEEDEQAVRPMRASTARDSRRMSRTVGTAGLPEPTRADDGAMTSTSSKA
jgi:hypothetical protein